MVIDFHTHTFPDALAATTIPKLATAGNVKHYTNGTKAELRQSMQEAGVDYSVLLPIATKPAQTEKLNRLAAETNETTKQTGLLSFGTLHPDCEDYKTHIRQIAHYGIKGVKLHPCYQNTALDDIRILRIVDYLQEFNLITIFHAGYDVGFPGNCNALPTHCLHLIEELHPRKLVLAHMGGWGCWEEVLEKLAGRDVYFDTAFSIGKLIPYHTDSNHNDDTKASTEKFNTTRNMLSKQQFVELVHKHGADRILFGTDSPWSSQKETLLQLENCGLSEKELIQIKGENAKQLLKLE